MEAHEAFKFSGEDAEYYDRLLGPILFEPYGHYLASKIDLAGVESVLEIACGTGRVTRQIRKALPPSVKFIASDLSNDMLAIARQELNNNGINFRIEDAQNLSFPDNSFDLVICQFGMMFLPDREKGFCEIYRVLKPGGKFMYFTWDDTKKMPLFKLMINDYIVPNFEDEDTTRFFLPFSMYDPVVLENYLTGAGFKNVHAEHVALTSGVTTAKDVVDAFLLKHRLGREVAAKDPALLGPLSEKMEQEITSKFGEKDLQFGLSAFLTTGVK
jgi:SAM-dependent methyltransferase